MDTAGLDEILEINEEARHARGAMRWDKLHRTLQADGPAGARLGTLSGRGASVGGAIEPERAFRGAEKFEQRWTAR